MIKKNTDMFPLVSNGTAVKTVTFYKYIASHLTTLKERFESYFPVTDEQLSDWVRDPFHLLATASAAGCCTSTEDELADLQMDRTRILQHGDLPLDTVCLLTRQEYPSLSWCAIKVLIPFSIYLCELAFSSPQE